MPVKFNCPDCGQSFEMESVYGGQVLRYPTCGATSVVPTKWPLIPQRDDVANLTAPVPDPLVIQTIQSNIDRGSMTIFQYMAKQQIEGVVDLQSTEVCATSMSIPHSAMT